MPREKFSLEHRAPVKYPEVFHTPEIGIEPGSLVLMIGAPASGKSTFAKKHFPAESIVATDNLRAEITNNPGNQNLSEPAFAAARKIVEARMRAGNVVVVDAMNLSPKTRRIFSEEAKKYGRKVVGVHLDVSLKTLLERDAKRDKHIGADFITHKTGEKVNIDLLYHDHRLDEIYTVDEKMTEVKVDLPPEEKELLAEGLDFYAVGHRAQVDVFDYLKKYKERLRDDSLPRIPIKPNSINLIEDTPAGRRFLEQNTIDSQVVDLDFWARRMATTVDDPLVIETVSRLLDMRFKLNLVTFVLHSKKAEAGLNKITEVLVGRKMKAERLMADEKLLQEGVIDIDRGVLPEEKLLVLGDIHGCLLALQELKKRMTEEFKSDSTFPKRKIVFIGDVPDRGTYSALTVLYAANLVKSGAAEWIMGNHDVNMRNGLQLVRDTFKQSGKEWETWLKEDFNEEMLRPVVRSKATRRTILDLLKFIDIVDKGTLKKTRERARLRPRSLDALLDVLQTAPVYKEWRHLVAVHASLPRIPVAGEVLDANTEKKMTHGVKTYLGGVQDTLKIRTVVAKDPDRIVVAGHTHDPEVAVDVRSGTVGLDHSGEKIYGLKYPEMELISADEPYILEMITLAKSPELPTGQKLWELIRFLESQIMVKTNQGPKGSDYEGLTVVSYDEMTEVKSLWDHYPVLRNFRGVIIDNEGNIVARPFKKTHKAGVELPLETLDIVPEKIYEKANGSLGVCYFWKGEWRMATKFSLYNEGYTVPAKRMLDKMNTAVLDPKRTYLFEIILPTDPHIVDYEGREELVLLNANNTQTGEDLSWQEVEDLAGKLGCRTAEDMTTRFSGMTIAQIYKHAQTEGSLNNYEGLMAIYKDERTGESVTVKVKAVEYDNKKYVRDHLDWERMLDRLDWETLDMSDDDIEGFLSYKRDSQFVRAALEARINWVREEYDRIEQIFATEYKPYMDLALEKLQLLIQTDKNKKAVVDKTIREILSVMQSNGKGDEPGPVLDWIRCNLLGQPDRLRVYIESVIRKRIEKESKKRGHAAYWLLPE